jgi:sec-independent protein translocase protein TatB
MFEVGFTEIILILGLALIVLGPEKLPGLAEKVGRWTGRARSMARQLRAQLEHEVTLEELAKSKPMQAPRESTPTPGAAMPESAPSSELDIHQQLAEVDTSPEAMHGPRTAEPAASAAGTPETDPHPAELDTTPEAMHGTWKNKAPT